MDPIHFERLSKLLALLFSKYVIYDNSVKIDLIIMRGTVLECTVEVHESLWSSRKPVIDRVQR